MRKLFLIGLVCLASILDSFTASAQFGTDPRDEHLWWREDPNPNDDVWPMSGEAPSIWRFDRTPTLWYEPDTGILQFVAARDSTLNVPVSMNAVFILSDVPLFRDDISEENIAALGGPFDSFQSNILNKITTGGSFNDVDFGEVMLTGLVAEDILDNFLTNRWFQGDERTPPWDLVVADDGESPPVIPVQTPDLPPILTPGVLQPGDADRDGDVDQFDLIRVSANSKYPTGEAATWGEGDWDGGPGRTGMPSIGDDEFNQFDIIKLLKSGFYLRGPYDEVNRENDLSLSPILCCGIEDDDRTSLVYDADSGEMAINAPVGRRLNSINIESAAGIFTEENIAILDGPFDIDSDATLFKSTIGSSFGDISLGRAAQAGFSQQFLLDDLSAIGSFADGGLLDAVDLIYLGTVSPQLLPGDANQDLSFDQLDIVRVSQSGKYLSGQTATWGEGDWDGAPGGWQGNPPPGNGLFDQLDIVAALAGGHYLQGPYAALQPGGSADDEQTSLVYDSTTGQLSVDAPASTELSSIFVTSAGNLFIGEQPTVLDGPFDSFGSDNLFESLIGGSFGDLSFGNVLPAGLAEADLLTDLSAEGSLAAGGGLGPVDLIYLPVPEPAAMALVCVFLLIVSMQRHHGTVKWR